MIHAESLLGAAALLAAWTVAWRRRGRPPVGRVIAFAAGLLTALGAVNGPLHDLAERALFSAHMVQHLLLTLLVPPLFLSGVTGWMVDHVIRHAPVRAVASLLTRPPIAFGVSNAVLALWHFPGPYGAAMANHDVHIAMHLTLMVTAGMLWWPVLSPTPALPRLPRAGQLLYLFALGLPMSVIGAFITLADHPLYRFYVTAPRLWGLSPLDDQRIGGLIMWVPGMIVFWTAMTVVWFKWAREEKEETD